MSDGLSVEIGADVSDLRAKLALVQSDFRDFNSQTKKLADQIRDGGDAAAAEFTPQLEAMAAKAAAAKADIADLNAKIKEMQPPAAAHETASAFDEIKEKAEKFHGALGAALAGGEFLIFKELAEEAFEGVEKLFEGTVEKAMEFDLQTAKMAAELGISTGRAAALSEALNSVGSSADQYVSIALKLDKQVKSNEAGLNALGMVTRDQNGELLNQTELMDNAIATMGEYRAGTDQNEVALTMFGRGAKEVYDIMRVSQDEVRAFNEILEEMGVSTMPEAARNSAELESEMAKAKAVFDGFGISLGQHIGPEFKEFFVFIRDDGAPVLDLIGRTAEGAFMIIDAGLTSISEALQLAWGLVINFSEAWNTLSRVIVDVTSGDFSKVQSDWAAGTARMEATWKKTFADMGQTADQFGERMENLALGPIGGGANLYKSGDKSAPAGGAAQKDQDAQYQAAIAQINAQVARFKEGSDERIAYLNIEVALAADEYGKDSRQYFEELAKRNAALRASEEQGATAHKQAVEAAMESYRADAAQFAAGSDQRIAKLRQELDYVRQALGDKSKEYASVEAEINAQVREHAQQNQQAELSSTMAFIQDKNTELNAGIAHYQKLEQEHKLSIEQARQDEVNLTNTIYGEDLKRLDDTAKTLDKGTALWAKAMQDRVKLAQQEADQLQKINDQAANEEAKKQEQTDKAIAQSGARTVMGLISGRETLLQAFDKIAEQMLEKAIEYGLEEALKAISFEEIKTAATEAGEASRLTSKQAGAVAGKAVDATTGAATILGDANTAAGGAYAAVSNIPVIGPILAPAAAAAAFTAVMAYDVFSAEGGFDVPSGLNPLTQLHEREMVLPASIADVMRNLDGNGGGDTHYHVDMSGASFGAGVQPQQMKSMVVAALRQAHREGAFA